MRIMTYRPDWLILLGMLLALCACAWAFDAEAFWREQTTVPFDVVVLQHGEEPGITWQSLVYTSEIRQEQPMRIFAYYARPAAPGKYPAVLSIHGGGGSADLERAKAFAKAGYPCLSYDWNNFQDPKTEWKPGDPLPAKPYTVYGTLRYDDWGKQFALLGPDGKDAVLYRSVMAARRGLTWLSQQPEVDANRLAVEGHSWGGFTTQLVTGIDSRVKAAVSSAAAGAWMSRYHVGLEGHINHLSPWEAFNWTQRYDPAAYADRVTAPILIRLATADFFGSVDTLQDYWDTITAPHGLELEPSSNHGFADVETRVAWFDHWLKNGPDFPAVTNVILTPESQGRWTVRLQAKGPAEITNACVCWTTSPKPWNARQWADRPLTRDGDAWTGTVTPVNAGGPLRLFVTVRDANGHAASSMPQVRTLPKPATVPDVITEAKVPIPFAAAPPAPTAAAWQTLRPVGPLANGPEVLGERSAHLSAQWDANALYLRVQIDDASPWSLRPAKAPWWDGDSLQLRMRTEEQAADKLPGAQQHALHLGWYPAADGAVQLDAVRGADFKGIIADLSPVTSTVEVQQGKGYILYTTLPWSFIDPAFVPKAGRVLRLGLVVNFGNALTGSRVSAVDFNHGNEFNNGNAWGLAELQPAP